MTLLSNDVQLEELLKKYETDTITNKTHELPDIGLLYAPGRVVTPLIHTKSESSALEPATQ